MYAETLQAPSAQVAIVTFVLGTPLLLNRRVRVVLFVALNVTALGAVGMRLNIAGFAGKTFAYNTVRL